MLLAFTIFELASITLVVVLLFLGFKLAETNWSYKISKPHAWEEAIKKGEVSKKLKGIERSYRDKVRLYTFWLQIERLKKENVMGAFAEVGVYQGETAKLIHEMDNSRKFHLFDTFEGFNKQDIGSEKINEVNRSIDFSDTTVESVLSFINGNSNIVIHKGYFPTTTENLVEEKYAFVHLDADLYNPTLAGLQYFYPRLTEGGVIIIHDYNHTWEGVTKAVDEFSKTIYENPVEIADWQGSVMIVKNRFNNSVTS
jgi:O-methyltransferase